MRRWQFGLLGFIIVPTAGAVAAECGSLGRVTDWPTFHFDAASTGGPPSEAGPYFADMWRFQAGGAIQSSPALAGNLVYFGSYDGRVYALNASTGALVWSSETEGRVTSSPAVVDGTLFVGSEDGRVYALDAQTGDSVWVAPTNGRVVSSPVVSGGLVLIGSEDGYLYALDALSGELRWRFLAADAITSSPRVGASSAVVGSADGNIYAVDIRTGLPQWVFATRVDSPTIVGTQNYVAASPAMDGARVYVPAFQGRIYALDRATGLKEWHYELGGPGLAPPTVADGLVFVGAIHDANITALDARSGEVAWRYQTDSWILSSPAVADGVLYVGTVAGGLLSLDAKTGALHDMFATEGPSAVQSSPAVSGQRLFAGDDGGHLYAFALTFEPGVECGVATTGTGAPLDVPAFGPALLLLASMFAAAGVARPAGVRR